MQRLVFDYSELRGLIVAKYGTCAAFAKVDGTSRSSLSAKLNNKVAFTPEDVYRMSRPEALDIPTENIGRVFYTPKV